jgi:hypothetical protein
MVSMDISRSIISGEKDNIIISGSMSENKYYIYTRSYCWDCKNCLHESYNLFKFRFNIRFNINRSKILYGEELKKYINKLIKDILE